MPPEHPPYVALPEAVVVMVDGPRGRFRGIAEGYAGTKVDVWWTEGIGERYVAMVDASKVTRVGHDEEPPPPARTSD